MWTHYDMSSSQSPRVDTEWRDHKKSDMITKSQKNITPTTKN